jgi:hypothetical protein
MLCHTCLPVVPCRKAKKGDGEKEHKQKTLKMQPLIDDTAEPTAPGTPEPPTRDAEAVPAAAVQEPAAAVVDPVAEALKGNEKLFIENVSLFVCEGTYRMCGRALKHAPAMRFPALQLVTHACVRRATNDAVLRQRNMKAGN